MGPKGSTVNKRLGTPALGDVDAGSTALGRGRIVSARLDRLYSRGKPPEPFWARTKE